MAKPSIAVFSGPRSTITNSPPLVTSRKARLPGERGIEGTYDHLIPQVLYEPVTVKIKKFSAHPLEEDASEIYHDDGKPYYEVTLSPEDGPYPLPYMARRRARGKPFGVPFEAEDLKDPKLEYGGRQSFYPDLSRIFMDIDRSIVGRGYDGKGNFLGNRADYDFIRVLPPAGYRKKGEVAGVDYFPYFPHQVEKSLRPADLARAANMVSRHIASGKYDGAVWLEGTTSIEETLYWLSLMIDTDLPIAGTAAQRPFGQLSNDGPRNIVDCVDYIVSGKGRGIGVVGIHDQVVYAAREVKKGDDRPGGFKSVGGHGGILGSVKGGSVTIWHKPAYKHTRRSDVNLTRLPVYLEAPSDGGRPSSSSKKRITVKDESGSIKGEAVPRVHIIKTAAYEQEDEREDPDREVGIMALVERAVGMQESTDVKVPKLHGLVLEGSPPYARGSVAKMKAIRIAASSGIPVVRVTRSDPGGRVYTEPHDLTIEGNNLDANKARILLMASMLKLGRLPSAKDPRNPTEKEKERIVDKVALFQEIFETH